MPSIDILSTYCLAAFLLCIAPGPSNLYIMARSISQGYEAGVVAASGMVLGSLVYVIASAFGLAAIFLYSPLAYTSVKIAGALYLLYLAYHYVHQARQHVTEVQNLTFSTRPAIFRQSLVVELTNPKTALFFIAFLPLFTEPTRGSITTQLLVLGAIYTVIGFFCDLMVAGLSGKIGKWMHNHHQSAKWQNCLSASLLFIIAGFIVYEEVLAF